MSRFIRILIFTLLMAAIVFFAFRATQPGQITDSTNAPDPEQSTSTSESASNEAVENEAQAPAVEENKEDIKKSADTEKATPQVDKESNEGSNETSATEPASPAEQVEKRVIEGSAASTTGEKIAPSEVEKTKNKVE